MPVRSIVGEVIIYVGTSAPSGWLVCDGSAVSRTTYAELFAIIGTAYGVGNGTTTFNLPNLAGRMVVGSSSAANFTQGSLGGADTVVLTTAQIPSHNHSYSPSSGKSNVTNTHASNSSITVGNNSANHTHASFTDLAASFYLGDRAGSAHPIVNNPAGGTALSRTTSFPQSFATQDTVTNETGHNWTSAVDANHTHTGTLSGGGSDVGHENRPPFIGVTYLIKY